MITSSLDNLIHKVGGPLALSKAMEVEGVSITHSAILYWYKSKSIHPKKAHYKEALLKIAEKQKLKISLES